MPRRTRSQIEQARKRSDANHTRHIWNKYGITASEYAEIKAYQGGKCYICQRASGKTRRLAVDHCHKTGRIRGVLCKGCNRMLGHGRDDPMFFVRASLYLSDPPAFDVIGERVVPDVAPIQPVESDREADHGGSSGG